MTASRVQLWSSGGGTQSAAIAALIVRGDIQKPDLAVIVDTEREKSATWAYHDSVIVPALAAVGVTLHRVVHSDCVPLDRADLDDANGVLFEHRCTSGLCFA